MGKELDFWKNRVSQLECGCVNKQNEIDKLESKCENIYTQLMETEKDAQERIVELETELKAKNDLPTEITIDGYKCEIIKTEEGLYINRDRIYEIIDKEKKPLKDKIAELEDRHQQDCIEINRLNTVIDVLIDKHSRLRQQIGM